MIPASITCIANILRSLFCPQKEIPNLSRLFAFSWYLFFGIVYEFLDFRGTYLLLPYSLCISEFSWYLLVLYSNCNATFSWYLLFWYSICFPGFSGYLVFHIFHIFWSFFVYICIFEICIFYRLHLRIFPILSFLICNILIFDVRLSTFFSFSCCFLDSFFIIISLLNLLSFLFWIIIFTFSAFKPLCRFAENRCFFNKHLLALLAVTVQWTFINCTWKCRVAG